MPSTASTTSSSTSATPPRPPTTTPAPWLHRTAYRGLETGSRDRVSHVLEQGRIRLVLTGTLTGDDEIAEHHQRHGDGVRSIALSVPDAAAAYEHAVAHRARGVETPYELTDEYGRVRLASVATYGDTVTCSSSARLHRSRSSPGTQARDTAPAGRDGLLVGIDHVVGTSSWGTWRSGSTTTSAYSA